MLPGDTLTRDGSLAYLSTQTPGFHVGSKTALAWRGVSQNIAFREHLSLWGDTPRRLPEWFTQRFPAGYLVGPAKFIPPCRDRRSSKRSVLN